MKKWLKLSDGKIEVLIHKPLFINLIWNHFLKRFWTSTIEGVNLMQNYSHEKSYVEKSQLQSFQINVLIEIFNMSSTSNETILKAL